MSSETTSSSSSGGIGFCGLLTILLIGLKLSGTIDFAWVWILSPLWVPLALGLAVMLFIGLVALVAAIAGHWRTSGE